MSSVSEKPVITLDDQNYVIEDLSDKAKYMVGQLQDLAAQIGAAKARLDQLQMANDGFVAALREELKEEEE
jgi:Tfp pilus assembly protein PilN